MDIIYTLFRIISISNDKTIRSWDSDKFYQCSSLSLEEYCCQSPVSLCLVKKKEVDHIIVGGFDNFCASVTYNKDATLSIAS
jgi:hypothetical protein